jgi:hypothetical protein
MIFDPHIEHGGYISIFIHISPQANFSCIEGSSWLWSWSYGSWISTLKLWVWIPGWWGVLNITLCDKVCQWLTAGQWFSLGTPISSTNKTDSHDITEILLKVALNTIMLILTNYKPIFDADHYEDFLLHLLGLLESPFDEHALYCLCIGHYISNSCLK